MLTRLVNLLKVRRSVKGIKKGASSADNTIDLHLAGVAAAWRNNFLLWLVGLVAEEKRVLVAENVKRCGLLVNCHWALILLVLFLDYLLDELLPDVA